MTLQEMLRTVWFGKWLVLVALVAAGAGAWFYLDGQEPRYAAETTVQIVDTETLAEAGVRLESDPSLATSDDVAAAAAKEVGGGVTGREVAAATTADYADETATQVAITSTGTDRAGTVDVANAVAHAYVAGLQTQFDTDVTGMQERLASLADTIDTQQDAITRARAAARGGSDEGTVQPVDGLLEAQNAASMDQYQTLSAQIAQAQVLAAPATVLKNAVTASLVSVPDPLVWAVALLAGLLLGIALAVLRRGLDTKIRTSGAARRAAGAPVLARLSGTGAALKTWQGEGTLPVATREATAYTRSVRELRTAVQAALPSGGRSAVIVVTSADVDSPRAFVAANLAASWALSGRSVVALSGDLRQPRLDSLLPADPAGEADAAGTRATAIPHLRVHPALRTELDPADFLASEQVRTLLDEVRRTADVVVIDAPPMLVAADATILGAYADGVLLAATVGHTPVGAVEESAERLRAAHARLLGLSLDGATGRRAAYEASYAYAGAQGEQRGTGVAAGGVDAEEVGEVGAEGPVGTGAEEAGGTGAEGTGDEPASAQPSEGGAVVDEVVTTDEAVAAEEGVGAEKADAEEGVAAGPEREAPVEAGAARGRDGEGESVVGEGVVGEGVVDGGETPEGRASDGPAATDSSTGPVAERATAAWPRGRGGRRRARERRAEEHAAGRHGLPEEGDEPQDDEQVDARAS